MGKCFRKKPWFERVLPKPISQRRWAPFCGLSRLPRSFPVISHEFKVPPEILWVPLSAGCGFRNVVKNVGHSHGFFVGRNFQVARTLSWLRMEFHVCSKGTEPWVYAFSGGRSWARTYRVVLTITENIYYIYILDPDHIFHFLVCISWNLIPTYLYLWL